MKVSSKSVAVVALLALLMGCAEVVAGTGSKSVAGVALMMGLRRSGWGMQVSSKSVAGVAFLALTLLKGCAEVVVGAG